MGLWTRLFGIRTHLKSTPQVGSSGSTKPVETRRATAHADSVTDNEDERGRKYGGQDDTSVGQQITSSALLAKFAEIAQSGAPIKRLLLIFRTEADADTALECARDRRFGLARRPIGVPVENGRHALLMELRSEVVDPAELLGFCSSIAHCQIRAAAASGFSLETQQRMTAALGLGGIVVR